MCSHKTPREELLQPNEQVFTIVNLSHDNVARKRSYRVVRNYQVSGLHKNDAQVCQPRQSVAMAIATVYIIIRGLQRTRPVEEIRPVAPP